MSFECEDAAEIRAEYHINKETHTRRKSTHRSEHLFVLRRYVFLRYILFLRALQRRLNALVRPRRQTYGFPTRYDASSYVSILALPCIHRQRLLIAFVAVEVAAKVAANRHLRGRSSVLDCSAIRVDCF